MSKPKRKLTPEELVLREYPNAHCWWNCLEFDWLIWDRPEKPVEEWRKARTIGGGQTQEFAWQDAARRIARKD